DDYMPVKIFSLFIFLFLNITSAWGAGMVPQSSIVIIEEEDGEGNIDIKNTDKYPSLLITRIENIEEDPEELITVYPPVARVEGNDTQTVRFLITTKEPLKVERLKRATFEGVPPKNSDLGKEINVTFKQNLPVIIRPAGLARNLTPWKELNWKIENNQLIVNNPSPYIVRFISPNVTLIPGGQTYTLPKSYILPHSSFSLTSNNKVENVKGKNVRIYPATTWGFATGKYFDALVTE
ncbi:fimbria/pilus chaperone family protein, partial [Providencia manganoxydans]